MGYKPARADAETMRRLCVVYSEAERIRQHIAAETDRKEFAALNRLLDSKYRIILNLERCLFLNPEARLRGLPQKAPEKDLPESLKRFADRL